MQISNVLSLSTIKFLVSSSVIGSPMPGKALIIFIVTPSSTYDEGIRTERYILDASSTMCID